MQADPEFDFRDTRVFCVECSLRKQAEREGVQPPHETAENEKLPLYLDWAVSVVSPF